MTASHTYLGIDLGTSELKVLLLSQAGAVLGTASSPLTVNQPHPHWSEQDPAAWMHALVQACKALQAAHPADYSAVQGIGLSGQMHGATLLGAQGQVLRPCILWNDSRSTQGCIELTTARPDLEEITGNLAMPGFTAPKLAWVRRP